MALWQRFSQSANLTTIGSHDNIAHLTNGQEADTFESKDLVIVDGIIVLHCNTDELMGFRFIIAEETIVTGDLTDTQPLSISDMVYYSWFWSRGPMVFRLRSKRTIPREYTLWGQLWKERGAGDATLAIAGMHLYIQQKN